MSKTHHLLLLSLLVTPSVVLALSSSTSSSFSSSNSKPIDPSGWPDRFPAKDHCSKCGLCETSFVSQVKEACAFLGDGMGRMDGLEQVVHGRIRNIDNEESRFGVLQQPIRLAKGRIQDAQWTGVTTSIAVSMLETGQVDAVVCIAKGEGDGWCNPEPIIARTVEDVMRGRGVKPALAPSLRVLDEIQQDKSIRKLLFCGVGCAVQAFRSVQDRLDLDEIYVLGTNCVDNSPTPEAAERFLQEGIQIDTSSESVLGYEFMQDFQVHVKTSNDYIQKPYFSLPGTIAAPSIATSCLACFDYTNGLADVVVGYMGAPLESGDRMDESSNTLTIRNERGSRMVKTAVNTNRLVVGDIATGSGNHESLVMNTVQADSIVLGMVKEPIPEQGMPVWMGKLMAKLITNFVSPKGLNFALYSIDYHVLRNYLHVLKEWGQDRAEQSMPEGAKRIVQQYLQDKKGDGSLRELVAKIKAVKEK